MVLVCVIAVTSALSLGLGYREDSYLSLSPNFTLVKSNLDCLLRLSQSL